MDNNFKVKGTIIEIGDVETISVKDNDNLKLLNFTIKVYNTDNLLNFSLYTKKKIDNFLRYNDIGQEIIIYFNINSYKYKDKYISNLKAYRTWTVKDDITDNPMFYFKK